MSRFFIALFLLLACEVRVVAQYSEQSSQTDPWLETLSALLVNRYQVPGHLQLAWNRARPANAPLDAQLALVDAPTELAPQILVTVRATDSLGRYADYTLVLRAEVWRDGFVLRDPVSPGVPLEPYALEIRRFDALRERDAIPADAKGEFDFARSVPSGRLLTWRDVTRRPLVRRGQTLDVVASDGSLTITLRAVALNDAARGEIVRVRNPDTKKDFVAEVVSEARASVRF